jgi:hypothetical protein
MLSAHAALQINVIMLNSDKTMLVTDQIEIGTLKGQCYEMVVKALEW